MDRVKESAADFFMLLAAAEMSCDRAGQPGKRLGNVDVVVAKDGRIKKEQS